MGVELTEEKNRRLTQKKYNSLKIKIN